MSAPIGNQFAKGNKGGRRKGYEYEKKQLEKMRRILNRDLALLQKFQKEDLTPKEMKKFEKTEKRVLKILDKLHANKQEHDIKSESKVILEGFDKLWK